MNTVVIAGTVGESYRVRAGDIVIIDGEPFLVGDLGDRFYLFSLRDGNRWDSDGVKADPVSHDVALIELIQPFPHMTYSVEVIRNAEIKIDGPIVCTTIKR